MMFQIADLLPRLSDYITKYAKLTPQKTALQEYFKNEQAENSSISYLELDTQSDNIAKRFLEMGLGKGDIIILSYPMTIEFNLLCIAAMKIGIIIAPLDLRWTVKEIVDYCEKISPKAYFFTGQAGSRDIAALIREEIEILAEKIPISMWIQSGGELLEGVTSYVSFLQGSKVSEQVLSQKKGEVDANDPCFIFFTTGYVGKIKPAVLSHDNILVQNLHVANWNRNDSPLFTTEDVVLANLPPSDVTGITEMLWTCLFVGATAVLIPIFDPQMTLEAIQKYRVTIVGQLLVQYKMELLLKEYSSFDLSSIKFLIFTRGMASPELIQQLEKICPKIGTGMGLTETAGLATFSLYDVNPLELTIALGKAPPNYEISIRYPMQSNGNAGLALNPGEIGEICFRGRQTFLGFYKHPDDTVKVCSKDGWLYTGDTGAITIDGRLILHSRTKMMIHTKGYSVNPDEVAEHLQKSSKIKDVVVFGRPHRKFGEAIIAIIELNPPLQPSDFSETLQQELGEELAGYKKPDLIIPVKKMPDHRNSKAEFHDIITIADETIAQLRREGKFDSEEEK
jgi:acyl-CoA synthetase (AMP-forming)/AMP-acid ligase II